MKKAYLADDRRFDAQFFQKRYLVEEQRQLRLPTVLLGSVAFITDGPHGYHELDDASPVAMLTASDAAGWFASRASSDLISMRTHEANLRSALCEQDVILSTRGTLGMAALVRGDSLPANIDQDLARIHLSDDSPIRPEYLIAYLHSEFGKDWIERHATGMVQQGISLNKLRSLRVPVLSQEMQRQIALLLAMAFYKRANAGRMLQQSSDALAAQFGLPSSMQAEELSSRRTLQQVSSAERFDAEYFDPAVQATIARLGRQNTKIRDVAELRCESFTPEAGTPFHYIEISDVSQDGSASGETLDGAEAPSRAKWMVRDKDVLTSTVRPVRRLSALIEARQDGAVASSGFAVLQPRGIAPEVLLTYLRLPVICELMDLHTTASMYPAIAVRDILNLPFLRPSADVEHEIVNAVTWARHSRERAAALLERAKRAVDVAIEESEEAALAFLRSFGE